MINIATTKVQMKKHIDAAIKLEQKGINKYNEFSRKTHNYYGKLMFERLALEEEKHALILESWKERLDSLKVEKGFDASTKLTTINASDIFPARKRDKKGITKDYITALTYAIDIEEKSYDYYKELEHIAENPELKKLFKELSKFEHEHMKLFKKELDFAQSNPMAA